MANVSIPILIEKLKRKTEWQKTPRPLTSSDYADMIFEAIKILYIDTGRAASYSSFEDSKISGGEYSVSFTVDEERYVLLTAQQEFFRKVQADVNNLVSYDTDALKVTNADKPYANIKNTISELELERRRVFYAMNLYSVGISG